MTEVIGNLSIKVGQYEKNGEQKGAYKQVGTLHRHSDGGMFITLDATILNMSLLYLANPGRKDRVSLNVLPPREDSRGGGGGNAGGRGAGSRNPTPGARSSTPPPAAQRELDDLDGDIPF